MSSTTSMGSPAPVKTANPPSGEAGEGVKKIKYAVLDVDED
jgi:hypothetical protein